MKHNKWWRRQSHYLIQTGLLALPLIQAGLDADAKDFLADKGGGIEGEGSEGEGSMQLVLLE